MWMIEVSWGKVTLIPGEKFKICAPQQLQTQKGGHRSFLLLWE
jgi:hypothetical protein